MKRATNELPYIVLNGENTMKHCVIILITILMFSLFIAGCDEESGGQVSDTRGDVVNQMRTGDKLSQNQPTPNDVEYSLERYNLIRRTYWVNGQREKANALICPVAKPMGYILLFSPMGTVIGNFVVDGKVSSLRNYLTPDSEYYERLNDGKYNVYNRWLPDVDGAYGDNPDGIFFFDIQGNYYEWCGSYLYSDVLFEIDGLLKTTEKGE